MKLTSSSFLSGLLELPHLREMKLVAATEYLKTGTLMLRKQETVVKY